MEEFLGISIKLFTYHLSEGIDHHVHWCHLVFWIRTMDENDDRLDPTSLVLGSWSTSFNRATVRGKWDGG